MSISRQREEALKALEATLEVSFENRALLDEALTHSSYANERRGHPYNERLEFLGDAVVGLVVSDMLFTSYPQFPEGELARAKANLVSASSMARIGRDLRLEELILLGRGEQRSGGRGRDTIIADAVEAVIGAVYLDQPWATTHALVARLWSSPVDRAFSTDSMVDPKSALQEYLQGHSGEAPEYRLKATHGPDHAKTFLTEVVHGGRVLAVGRGHSKKEAEQEAARRALKSL